MIKTYDEALKKLNDLRTRLFVYATDKCCSKIEECVSELDVIAKFFIYEKRKKPTLKEVEKEWEELGYIWEDVNESVIKLHDYDQTITLYPKSKQYCCKGSSLIKLNIHQLITKTFKALEVFDG